MSISEQIENEIKQLKDCRYKEDKAKQYFNISTSLNQYFKQVNQNRFKRDLVLSFFEADFFPLSTRDKHASKILSTLKENGIIADDRTEKTYRQQRQYTLKSNDFEGSYFAMMKANGYTKVNHFVWYCDRSGIPRRRKVATSNINGTPRDKNGDIYGGQIDLSVLAQTIPQEKQGVYSYGNKSIATEKRTNFVKCFKVIA